MEQIDLNGLWDFVVDLDPKYHDDPRIYSAPTYTRPEISRRHWTKVPVPGVWNKYAERYDIFQGVGWFARDLHINALKDNAQARLRFGAVNYHCRVFINGKEAGSHEGGYTEFTIDVTNSLKPGKNCIVVRVDNRPCVTKFPACFGYFNYGGIHRGVSLEIMDGPTLDDIHIVAIPVDNGGRLTVSGRVLQSRPDVQVQIRCCDSTAETVVDKDGVFSCDCEVSSVKPWAPGSPHLYDVEVLLTDGKTSLDRTCSRCGFRTIEYEHGKILLNNRPLEFKGVSYVYDSLTSGLVVTEEQLDTDIALMKEMGVNAIRCHWPMDRKFYEACDREGMVVWIEPPVYCLYVKDEERDTPYSDPEWQKLTQQMAREMIVHARNHPSVVIYSLGNECKTNNPEAGPFFQALTDCMRRLDKTRLISYAALYGTIGPLANNVDVLGINSYWGWYDKCLAAEKQIGPDDDGKSSSGGMRDIVAEPINLERMHEMLDKILRECGNVPLLLTEFGADSIPGFFSRARDLWSENYHADLLKEIIKLKEEYPQILGTFVFCFCDYRDPSKQMTGYWDELNLKGVVDFHRNKKLAFYALRDLYRE